MPKQGTIEALPPEQQDQYRGDQLGALILGAGGPSGDPNANPRGGFSYLDNIAELLGGTFGKDNADVLLHQLLGTRVGADSTGVPYNNPEYKGTPRDLPSPSLGMIPFVPNYASDIPGHMGAFDTQRRDYQDIPTSDVGGSAGGQMKRQLQQLLEERVRKGRT